MSRIPDEYNRPDLVWIYDFEYAETHDVSFYIECAGRFGAPVLELGSGTGRVGIPLAEQGFEVWGLEASPLMIERMSRKMAGSPKAPLPIKNIEGDMTGFDLGREFPLIIIPINAFLLVDRAGQRSCLECCRKHLAPEGALVIDVFHPFGPSRAFDRSNEVCGIEKRVAPRFHPETGVPVRRRFIQRRDFFNQYEYIDNTYEVDGPAGTVEYSFTEELRFVYPSEMELMLEAAGFEVFRVFGWYDGREFSPLSEIMIFVAR